MIEPNASERTQPLGRYCLAVCYCGKCAHFKPIPPSNIPKLKPKTDERQAKSWAERGESTWIDKA